MRILMEFMMPFWDSMGFYERNRLSDTLNFQFNLLSGFFFRYFSNGYGINIHHNFPRKKFRKFNKKHSI
jgi:hypothetical protein